MGKYVSPLNSTPEVKPSPRPQMALQDDSDVPVTSSTIPDVERAPATSEAAKAPLVAPVLSRRFEHLADGSIRGVVIIEPEAAAQLKSWAESAGESLEEYLPKTLNEALLSYCSGAEV